MNTWNKVCRACLSTKETFNYFLHQNVSPETYWFCTSVQINENEDLPNALCNSCHQLLIAYSDFKRTCIQSQNTLLSCSNSAISAAETLICGSVHESTKNDDTSLDINVKEECDRYEEDKRTCIQSQNILLSCSRAISAAKTSTCGSVHESTKNCDTSLDIIVKEDYAFDSFEDSNLACIQSQNALLSCSNSTRSAANTSTCGSDQEFTENDVKSLYIIVKEENACDRFEHDLNPGEYISESLEKKVKICKRKKKLSKLKREVKSAKKTKRYFLYSCELCNKKFKHHERFEAHKLEHDGKRVALRCLPCDKTFMTWSGLNRHKESTHTTVSLGSVSCRLCGRICKSRHTLRAHEKAHGQRASCVCHVCGKPVTNAVTLKAHLETHKVDRERRHTCEHCGKKFYTKTMLLSHISRQHTDRRFICEICSYPFTDKYNLAKHLLKHAGKKGYRCDICKKSFTTNGSLVEHKRIHSGEKPFVCSYCPKRFLSKRRLTDHHRIHTGEKPHRCGVCDQRFTQRGTLQRHMKVHDKRLVDSETTNRIAI